MTDPEISHCSSNVAHSKFSFLFFFILQFKFIVTQRRYLFYFIILGWSSNVNFSLFLNNRTSDLRSARIFCTPMVGSCQCMAKPIQYCKVKIKNKKKNILSPSAIFFMVI